MQSELEKVLPPAWRPRVGGGDGGSKKEVSLGQRLRQTVGWGGAAKKERMSVDDKRGAPDQDEANRESGLATRS